MTDLSKRTTRRSVVAGGMAVAMSSMALATSAEAGVVTQKNAKYQDKPKGAARCAICSYYIANAKQPAANGACKQVAGSISPNGWCQFYAKKAGAK